MKLIIDIPEEDYKRIVDYYNSHEIVEATYSYIKNGTPLDDIKAEKDWKFYFDHGYTQAKRDFFKAIDDIKAEIENMGILSSVNIKTGKTIYEGLCRHSDVLEIIDKHIGGRESERPGNNQE